MTNPAAGLDFNLIGTYNNKDKDNVVNLRETPNGKILKIIPVGDTFYYIPSNSEWYIVKAKGGLIGYIKADRILHYNEPSTEPIFNGKWRLTSYAPKGKQWGKHDWGEEIMKISPDGTYQINNGNIGTWVSNGDGTITQTNGISRNKVTKNDNNSLELTDSKGGRYIYSRIE